MVVAVLGVQTEVEIRVEVEGGLGWRGEEEEKEE